MLHYRISCFCENCFLIAPSHITNPGVAAPRQAWLWSTCWGKVSQVAATRQPRPGSSSSYQTEGLKATWCRRLQNWRRRVRSCLQWAFVTRRTFIFFLWVKPWGENYCAALKNRFCSQMGGATCPGQWAHGEPCLLRWAFPRRSQWAVHNTVHVLRVQRHTSRSERCCIGPGRIFTDPFWELLKRKRWWEPRKDWVVT